MAIKILIVEDELEIANAIKIELDYEGYEVTLSHDGFTGLSAARKGNFDIILLDWILPGITGIEICRRLRQTANQVPIILITAQNEIGNRVSGLDAGADDYLIKPFNVEELLARVRANLRRIQEYDQFTLTFADLQLNLQTREVYRGERKIELTTKEFSLLEYMISNPHQILSRQQIIDKVWKYDIENNSRIEVHIRHLRKKLEAKQEKRLIQTIRGIGYTLRE